MSWWWSGVVGVAKKKMDAQSAAAETQYQSRALVVGASGLVGTSLLEILPLADTPGGPWKVFAVTGGHSSPLLLPVGSPHVEHIDCDISDPSAAFDALFPLCPEITHLFFLAGENLESTSENLRNILNVLIPSAANLVHICLETGCGHYIGDAASLHDPPYHEGLPRLEEKVLYYDLEDILVESVARTKGKVSWSVHRPSVVLGFAPNSATNLISSLCVYALICKKGGLQLRWPGSRAMWEGFSDASDADLVAEHQIWAVVEPFAKNEAFNCSDGDVFKWKQLWPMLAVQFELEWVGYEGEAGRFKLEQEMAGKESIWEEIAVKNDLLLTQLEQVANWNFTDSVLNAQGECLLSMNKSKEYSFLGFRNTAASFVNWIEKMKAYKIIP